MKKSKGKKEKGREKEPQRNGSPGEIRALTEDEMETLKDDSADQEAPHKEEKSKEEEYYDRLVRLSADFDNYKKRVLKEKAEFSKYANERLIKEIIPILDNLELALESSKSAENNSKVIEGIELILNQFRAVLKKEGVEAVSSTGKEFNPFIHEAISHIPSADHAPNTIISEQQKAYYLNKKLIRPAKVVVAKAVDEEVAKEEKPEAEKEEARAPSVEESGIEVEFPEDEFTDDDLDEREFVTDEFKEEK